VGGKAQSRILCERSRADAAPLRASRGWDPRRSWAPSPGWVTRTQPRTQSYLRTPGKSSANSCPAPPSVGQQGDPCPLPPGTLGETALTSLLPNSTHTFPRLKGSCQPFVLWQLLLPLHKAMQLWHQDPCPEEPFQGSVNQCSPYHPSTTRPGAAVLPASLKGH
jgi:hypothetical protein